VSRVESDTNPAGIITNIRAIESNVLVDDGSIVVLGGLVQDSVVSNVEKVPLLGDLPIIGHLFRFETRRQQKTNLMVFLRPYVVRDDSAARSHVIDRYDQMRNLEESTRQAPHPVMPQFEPPLLPPLAPGAKPGAATNPPAESPATAPTP
jgi:general secretion pathway protein D